MRCAVLGSPVSHSLSPVVHRAAYAAMGLDWTYDAFDVSSAELGDFLRRVDADWRGLSLTMPLKRAVVPLLDAMDETSSTVGVVNTVVLENDGRRLGYNTDVAGMVASLAGAGVESIGSGVVVGGGATAASALAALTRLGASTVTLVLRDPTRAAALRELAGRLGLAVDVVTLAAATACRGDVLVSTIPPGAGDPWALSAAAPVVLDVNYAPWPTPLADASLAAGHRVVGGVELLVHQAAVQVELMTGVSPAPVGAMRAAALGALHLRSTPPPSPQTG